jgi:hypothetical protein
MKRIQKVMCACLMLAATHALHGASKKPADYPFRVHIFSRNQTNFYHHHELDESKGEGRANIVANGDVRGIDFSFDCSEKLRPSFGFETYPAKWKKQDRELVVLLPVFGKTGSYSTCNLKTSVRNDAYLEHDNRLSSESSTDFKAWMVRRNYDPEHGKDVPTKPQTAPEKTDGAASKPSD